MESDNQLDPAQEPRPAAPGLGSGLASLLPPDADDDAPELADRLGRRDASDRLGAESPALSVPTGQTRDLNDVVHGILIVGLLISTALLLIGLILDLLTGKALPAAVLLPASAFQHALELDPSGFLSLGLLVLMFTPVVRVLGSIFVFLWERDWLYFGVTVFVFLVMLLSVILGRV